MEIENLYITVGDETYINIPSLYTLNADVYIVLVSVARVKHTLFLRACLTTIMLQVRNLFTCVHAKIILSAVERGELSPISSRMLKKHYGKKKQTLIIIVEFIANKSWGETTNGYIRHVAIAHQ